MIVVMEVPPTAVAELTFEKPDMVVLTVRLAPKVEPPAPDGALATPAFPDSLMGRTGC